MAAEGTSGRLNNCQSSKGAPCAPEGSFTDPVCAVKTIVRLMSQPVPMNNTGGRGLK